MGYYGSRLMVKGIHNIKKHERFENVISRIRELENFLFEHESHDGSARRPEGESQFENCFYSNTDDTNQTDIIL